jgi:hypothetical protein
MAKRQSIPHFSNFPALMEGLVLPHLQAHPEYERLDGLSGKGNRECWGVGEANGFFVYVV